MDLRLVCNEGRGYQRGYLWGRLLNHSKVLRGAQRLALTAAISALATAGLTISTIRLALAEFEIEESTVEKGEHHRKAGAEMTRSMPEHIVKNCNGWVYNHIFVFQQRNKCAYLFGVQIHGSCLFSHQ